MGDNGVQKIQRRLGADRADVVDQVLDGHAGVGVELLPEDCHHIKVGNGRFEVAPASRDAREVSRQSFGKQDVAGDHGDVAPYGRGRDRNRFTQRIRTELGDGLVDMHFVRALQCRKEVERILTGKWGQRLARDVAGEYCGNGVFGLLFDGNGVSEPGCVLCESRKAGELVRTQIALFVDHRRQRELVENDQDDRDGASHVGRVTNPGSCVCHQGSRWGGEDYQSRQEHGRDREVPGEKAGSGGSVECHQQSRTAGHRQDRRHDPRKW